MTPIEESSNCILKKNTKTNSFTADRAFLLY